MTRDAINMGNGAIQPVVASSLGQRTTASVISRSSISLFPHESRHHHHILHQRGRSIPNCEKGKSSSFSLLTLVILLVSLLLFCL